MRKRIFFPILILLILLPLLIFLFSYTRFFNDEVRSILTSVVDEQTNARLYLGDIHGSILGSFTIDGAALLYRNDPIALIDTIRISYLPLSLITKTVEALHVELVDPRFYLKKYKDGTYNVDHISKSTSQSSGRFDWTVILKSVKIRGGEFLLYDSTATGANEQVADSPNSADNTQFNASHFTLKNISIMASAIVTGDNLTANVKNVSLNIGPPDFRVDSLKFDFFTSPGGTEISGFRLKSNSTFIHTDLTLMGQSLLDSLSIKDLRQKHLTANVEARDIDLKAVEDFLRLPLDPVSKFDLSFFVSGSLDTLSVKQFLLKTDSSSVPLTAALYNVLDSSMAVRVEMNDALVNTVELSSLLKSAGMPDISQMPPVHLNAAVDGKVAGLLNVALKLNSGEAEIVGSSQVSSNSYDGNIVFHGIDVGKIFKSKALITQLNGSVGFSLKSSSGAIPDGDISITVDSSSYDRTLIHNAKVTAASVGDSINISLNFLTVKGNIDGRAALNVDTKNYSGEFALSEFDIAPFIHVPTLEGNLTGRLNVSGNGFDIDSASAELSFLTEGSTIGNFPLDNSAFTLMLNTEASNKVLQFYSPYVDANVNGSFVPHELPSQLSSIFSALADSFSNRILGKHDSARVGFSGASNINASIDVKVKDARFIGKLLGNTELNGNPETHLRLVSDASVFSMNGLATADTLHYVKDSLKVNASKINVQFNLKSNNNLSVWNSSVWSVNANLGALDINQTRLAAKILKANYTSGDSSKPNLLSVTALGQVDTLLEFYVDATANIGSDSMDITANTLLGKLYGVSLTSQAPVHISYVPEIFFISPATFSAGISNRSSQNNSNISLGGSYSLNDGANLHFKFFNFALASLQKLARLDTNTLKLNGAVSGDADLTNSDNGIAAAVNFSGSNVEYSGAKAKLANGKIHLSGSDMALSVELSKREDSTRYALRLDGNVPLSSNSSKGLHLNVITDSLDISFLTPLLAGVQNFGGVLSGNMIIAGEYSSPDFKGAMQVNDGKIRLAANEINYLYNGRIVGEHNKLVLSPLVIRNVPGQTGGTMEANGSVQVGENTIKAFDIGLNGSLLVLSSTAQRSLKVIYGSAIVGAGQQGLKLKGSLARPMLEGTVNIQNADLTLPPLQKSENLAAQEIVYHFPVDTTGKKSAKVLPTTPAVPQQVSTSGSLIDSLRYDVEVETKGNVNLRMIFDPTTNEELNAVLGGRLHLSNLSGTMELTGDVNIQQNSYYNFYKQFAATGRLRFTGDPLNPILDITAQYQGDHYADTSSTKAPEVVVVQLKITGTFDLPKVNISMTIDNNPFQGDPQTNAISFILTNQFENELTSSQKTSVANNLWAQAGAGLFASYGSSILSGILTNLFGREFSFIRSAELRYSSLSDFGNPDVAITTQFGSATIKVGGQVFSDINNTDVSIDYPLTEILGNRLYLQLSRRVALSNRSYFQRETINTLRLFYQLSF